MSKINTKEDARRKRKLRIRKHVFGTSNKPRLAVFRSLNHIYAQAIDDQTGKTILSASSVESEVKGKAKKTGNKETAKFVGELSHKNVNQKELKRLYLIAAVMSIMAVSKRWQKPLGPPV